MRFSVVVLVQLSNPVATFEVEAVCQELPENGEILGIAEAKEVLQKWWTDDFSREGVFGAEVVFAVWHELTCYLSEKHERMYTEVSISKVTSRQLTEVEYKFEV